MKSNLKKLVNRVAHKLGYVISRRETTLARDPFTVMRRLTPEERVVIFDVGAYVGSITRRFRTLFPEASIHCFEPCQDSFKHLSEGLQNDPLAQAYMMALSDSSGCARLNVNARKYTSSLLPVDKRGRLYWGNSTLDPDYEEQVTTCTVDGFCAEKGLERIQILKLDVQGAEFAVLGGAASMLSRQAIDIVYMELIVAPTYVLQHNLCEYLALFDRYGYVLLDIYDEHRTHSRLIQCDCLFVTDHLVSAVEKRAADALTRACLNVSR